MKTKEQIEDMIAENTHEAFLWLENDESLYIMAKKCKTHKHLKAMWGKHGPKRVINTRRTDWKQLFKDIKEE